jgi:predicted flavoprotein YhiN
MQMLNQYDIVIIGAGPAGLMTAIESFRPNKNIIILEKKYKPALKLRILLMTQILTNLFLTSEKTEDF